MRAPTCFLTFSGTTTLDTVAINANEKLFHNSALQDPTVLIVMRNIVTPATTNRNDTISIARRQPRKYATNTGATAKQCTHVTMEEQLKSAFSLRSVQRLHKEEQLRLSATPSRD
jgi:hypothetical protein